MLGAHVITVVLVSTVVQIDPFKLLMQFVFSKDGQGVHHSSKATKAQTGKLVNCNNALPKEENLSKRKQQKVV